MQLLLQSSLGLIRSGVAQQRLYFKLTGKCVSSGSWCRPASSTRSICHVSMYLYRGRPQVQQGHGTPGAALHAV
eukprot:1160446-Pelagomonas_calceolata.AAC.8